MAYKNIKHLDNEVQKVLNIFLEKFKLDQNVEGILLAGSYAYGDASKNSDLDIYIVYKELDWRERGSTWINGFEIEYFINPEKQVYYYMDTESVFGPNTAHMLANGIVLYSKPNSETLNKLVAYAIRVLEKEIPEMTVTDIKLAKYSLDDFYKDLDDMNTEKNNFSYQIIVGEYIQLTVDLFFKIKRAIKVKSKRLPSQLKELDKTFYSILQLVFKSNYKLSNIIELKKYMETLLGGKREDEWRLKTNVTFN